MKTHYKLIAIENDDECELNKAEITIGRDIKSDIVLRKGYPSRHHAKITIIEDIITIEDLNSTNGTSVNNRKIYRPTIINEGDVIQFDSFAYHLVPIEKENSTVLMKNLKPLNAVEEESSVVIIGGFSANDETAVRESYPLPASWSLQDSNQMAITQEIDRYPQSVIDGMITNNLPQRDTLSAVMIVTSGKHESRLIGLSVNSEQQLWTMGRSESCPISFEDISISSRHACIFYNKGQWGISDERSMNGTKVNNNRLSQSRLSDNDVITLGQVDLIFRTLQT